MVTTELSMDVLAGSRLFNARPSALLLVSVVGFAACYAVAVAYSVGEAMAYIVLAGFLLHWLIYSRSVSTPLMLAVLSGLVLLPLVRLNELLAVVVYFLGCIFFVARVPRETDRRLVSALAVYYVGVTVHLLYFSPLFEGDTVTYFLQLGEYRSVFEYVGVFVQNILADPLWLTGFYQKFPMLYLPFYFSLDLSSPSSFVVINTTLWVATVLMLKQFSEQYTDISDSNLSPTLYSVLMLLSPLFIYYSSQFQKEVTTIFFTVLAAFLFTRDRYFAFLLVAASAFYLRPYALAMIAVYVLVFNGRLYWLVAVLGGSFSILLVYSRSAVTAINSAVAFLFVFVTPLPFELNNWLQASVTLRTVESSVVGGLFAVSVLFIMANRDVRREYALLALGISTYAVTTVLVGYTLTAPETYDLLTLGINLGRKKSLVHPLILLWAALTLQLLWRRLPNVEFYILNDRS